MKLYLAALATLLPAIAAAPDGIKGNALGNPNAPILVEIYSDFQCPACKKFHDEELQLIIKDYVNPVKAYLVYRYFPLPQHTYGRKTAELVCACAHIGKYEPAAKALFDKQESWSKDGKYEETLAAVLTPVEFKKVTALANDPSVKGMVDHDLAEGRAVPVSATPTLAITFKAQTYRIFGEGIFNYKWVQATFDGFLKQ